MTAADVLLPLIAVDDGTYYEIDCGTTVIRLPVHRFSDAQRLVRPGRGIGAVARDERGVPRRVGALWVECETRAQASRLSRLPAPPGVIFRDGGRVARTAVWWLSDALSPKLMRGVDRTWGEEANRRLAHALGAPKKHSGAEHLFCVGEIERAEAVRFSARDVVGRLPAAPVARSWRGEVAA